MKSIVLCEGPDDLWFIAYYLHKTAGWDTIEGKRVLWAWKNYQVSPLNDRQQVQYLEKRTDTVCIWCAAGKDGFSNCLKTIVDKYVKEIPADAVDSIVIVCDRDSDTTESILKGFEESLPGISPLQNKTRTGYSVFLEEGEIGATTVTPVIIPFNKEGAIETLLMSAVGESGPQGERIVQSAEQYVDSLAGQDEVRARYLSHARLILKAKYSSTIAITNPGHSTGLFQDMAMNSPWEESPYVKEHFDVIRNAITSDPT